MDDKGTGIDHVGQSYGVWVIEGQKRSRAGGMLCLGMADSWKLSISLPQDQSLDGGREYMGGVYGRISSDRTKADYDVIILLFLKILSAYLKLS